MGAFGDDNGQSGYLAMTCSQEIASFFFFLVFFSKPSHCLLLPTRGSIVSFVSRFLFIIPSLRSRRYHGSFLCIVALLLANNLRTAHLHHQNTSPVYFGKLFRQNAYSHQLGKKSTPAYVVPFGLWSQQELDPPSPQANPGELEH